MLKRNYEGQESCSVAQVLEIIDERWTWLIVRDALTVAVAVRGGVAFAQAARVAGTHHARSTF
jgi:DNA-binding HxlR family transcriptional regulator